MCEQDKEEGGEEEEGSWRCPRKTRTPYLGYGEKPVFAWRVFQNSSVRTPSKLPTFIQTRIENGVGEINEKSFQKAFITTTQLQS